VTPAEWMGLLGGGVGFLAGVGALVKLGADLRAPAPAPAPTAHRDAMPPPAPVAPPAAPAAPPRPDIDERVLRLETSAHELEVKVISELRALTTLINERTERGARRGSNG